MDTKINPHEPVVATDVDAEIQPTNDTIRELIAVCTGLVSLLARETRLLEAMRPGEIQSLQHEKAQLAELYEQRVKLLAADPTSFAAVEPVLREEVESALTALDVAGRANETAITAARTTNEHVIQAIVDAVAQQAAEASVYGPNGARRERDSGAASEAISFTLNERF